jgi:tetratricopeptide (TPR) repeat protein
MGLASLCQQDGDLDDSVRYLLMAEESFPGYDSPALSAERKLSALYKVLEKPDLAAQALERWLIWNAGAYTERLEVAQWHRDAGRFDRAAQLHDEANQVDPFRRDLHLAWAEVLVQAERWDEALREFEVGLIVPPDVDLDHQRFVGPPGGLPSGVDPEHIPALLAQGMDPELREGVPLTAEEQQSTLNQMADCARALGDEEQAAEYAERALALGEGS